MSSAEKIAANKANAQLSTGPTSETGRATSSKNALKSGLFSNNDFVLPGEEAFYTQLDESLRSDLAPQGMLEHHLVDEVRRAMWRLRRCGEVEAAMAVTCSETLTDAMQNEATAKLQQSVDRARAHSHRLFHRCTAELRKLQTERHIRHETTAAGTDLSHLGLCDTRAVTKAVDKQEARELAAFATDLEHGGLRAMPETPETAPTKQTQTPRNAQCPCKSGQKYKRCCGRNAPALLHAA